MRLLLLSVLLLASSFGTPSLYANSSSNRNSSLARQAIGADANAARIAIEELRAQGPSGLDALLQTHAAAIAPHLDAATVLRSNPHDAEWLRITAALDGVAQQKDSFAAGLYWYTDLKAAQTEARRTRKPILSLRLLGRLTDEYSCANSRFFRTVLYANPQVAQYLREHFILHWQSERPAPHVTIDFGDGRKIERTITGNSIHYIVDAEGRLLDALPGLYGPAAFLRALQTAEKLALQLRGQPDAMRSAMLQTYHRERLQQLNDAWAADLKRAGVNIERATETANAAPSAARAAPLAVTKRAVEMPLVRELNPDPNSLGAITDETAWRKIADLHAADAELAPRSEALMAQHLPPLLVNRKLTPEARLYVMKENFEKLIALDTVRNEYLMHTRLHSWLGADLSPSWDDINRRVYSEMFLTPRTDEWLGLQGPDTYTGLTNGGITP